MNRRGFFGGLLGGVTASQIAPRRPAFTASGRMVPFGASAERIIPLTMDGERIGAAIDAYSKTIDKEVR